MAANPEPAYMSVDEYLHSDFEPDCDYVEGALEDRNVGKRPHSETQRALLFALHRPKDCVYAYPEQRLRLTSTRYRVPDVCVYLDSRPAEDIFAAPPFLCIEILSDEDRPGRLLRKLNDYVQFGVRHIWVLDPWSREAFVFENGTLRQVFDELSTGDPRVRMPLDDAFADV